MSPNNPRTSTSISCRSREGVSASWKLQAHHAAPGGGYETTEISRRFGERCCGTALAARAQQAEPVRRIGIIMSMAPEGLRRISAVGQCATGLKRGPQRQHRRPFGPKAIPKRSRRTLRAEMVALAPDVILAAGQRRYLGAAAAGDPHLAGRSSTRADPVGAGLRRQPEQTGGNATGFTPVRNTA